MTYVRATGRRPAKASLADPAVMYSGAKRTTEGIDHLRRCSRARSRALRRMFRLFPAELEERWPKANRPKADGAGFPQVAYNREAMRTARALAVAHPDEFRDVLREELRREGIG